MNLTGVERAREKEFRKGGDPSTVDRRASTSLIVSHPVGCPFVSDSYSSSQQCLSVTVAVVGVLSPVSP